MNPDLIQSFYEVDRLLKGIDSLVMTGKGLQNRLIYFENRLTLCELRDAFWAAMVSCTNGQYDETAFQETLKAIFAARWERIRHTSAAYTEPRYSETNVLCLKIAKILAPLPDNEDEINNIATPTGPYFVLMPTLVAFQDISMTNIHNYSLHQIMLSDDGKLFIPIHDCIKMGKDNAEGLTHLCANPADVDQYAPLTQRELKAIAEHSAWAKQALDAVLALQRAKRVRGDDFASQLRGLVIALKGGGVHGAGQEEDSAAVANTGIISFFNFWDSLSPDIQQMYFASYPELQEYFGRLRRPDDADYREVIYCVDLISNRIESIIDHYHIVPRGVEQLKNNCDKALLTLSSALEPTQGSEIYFTTESQPPRILPLLYQLDPKEQSKLLIDSGSRDAWHYALLHEPFAIAGFEPLSENQKIIARNTINVNEGSALFIAVKAGCHEAVRVLLTFYTPAEINAQFSRETALAAAIRQKDTVLIKMLLEHHANPKINITLHYWDDSEDALSLAVKSGDAAVLDLLIPHMKASDMPILIQLARTTHSFAIVPLCRHLASFKPAEIIDLFRRENLLEVLDIGKPDIMRALFDAIKVMNVEDKKSIMSRRLLVSIITKKQSSCVPDFIEMIQFLSIDEQVDLLFPRSFFSRSYFNLSDESPFRVAYQYHQFDVMAWLFRALNDFPLATQNEIFSVDFEARRLLHLIVGNDSECCVRLVLPEILNLLRSLPRDTDRLELLLSLSGGPINPAAMPFLVEAISELSVYGQFNLGVRPDRLPSKAIPDYYHMPVSHRPEGHRYKRALWLADFNYHVLILEEQAQILRPNANALANELDVLCRALREDLNQFKQNPTADAWLDFNQSVRAHIAKSGPIVTKERGIKNILGNILICLTGIGALFVLGQILVDVAKGRQQVGFFKTKLSLKIDAANDFIQAKPVLV